MSAPLTQQTASALAQMLRQREVSAPEVAEAFLAAIETREPAIDAFLTLDPERTRAEAARAQALLDRGEGGPLTGVPVAVKDNICTEGLRTTCASRILENFVPPYSATVVEKMAAEGLVTLGKTNLDEFAMGTSCENSAFKVTRNPWDPSRVPGGSSGGSAAAVAAGMAPLSLGSDTGGSIRLPASLCGIVGFKPTYGRVSRYGLVAYGSSLDQIGPFATSVQDAALLAEAISGHCGMDSTSLPTAPISCAGLKEGSLRGVRFGLPNELFGDAIQPGVRAALEEAMRSLEAEGAQMVRLDLPSLRYAVSTYYLIAPAEASSNLARYDGVRFGPRVEGQGHVGGVASTRGQLFGHEVKARIMVGTYALSAGYYDAYYLRAQKIRGLMAAAVEAAFQEVDCLLSPASPVVAFPIGGYDDPLALKLLDLCTIPANMGGFPSLSLPAGFSDGLPVGLMLTGPVQADERLLQLAWCIEQALPEARRRPPLAG